MEATLVVAFLLCVFLLEIQEPEAIPIKLGNLVVVSGGLGVIGLTALWRSRSELPPMRMAAHDWVYGGYLLWCAAGVFWSVSPAQTFILSAYLAIVWTATMSLPTAPVVSTVRAIFWFAVAVAAASLAMLVVAPQSAFQPDTPNGATELRGIMNHQLRLGMLQCMAIGLTALAILNGNLRQIRSGVPMLIFCLAFLTCLVVLVLAKARGATAAFVLATMLVGLVSRNRMIAFGSLTGLVLLVLSIALFYDRIPELLFTTPSDATLSGRTLLWPKVLELADRRPWTGYGFGTFYQPLFDPFWRNYRPPSAHDSWLQAYFETGYVGAAFIVLLSIVMTFSGLYASLVLRRVSYTLFVGLFVLLSGIIDTVLAGKLTIVVTIMLLVGAQEMHELRAFVSCKSADAALR